jgi:HAD superfamily hydrolase (TIGR01509 family)
MLRYQQSRNIEVIMSITTILFDLDGTLLPMDQDSFVRAYFGLLAAKLVPHGYEAESLIKAIWSGTAAMVKNDGNQTNEGAFWNHFAGLYGEKSRSDEPIFAEFYHTDFQKVQGVCGFDPRAAQTIAELKAQGYTLVLATNPIFPAVATESRMRWAGLNQTDFIHYTTYENSSYCKPNPDYYRQVLDRIGIDPENCLMVGNDVTEDMVAAELGMKVFLLTDCLINKQNKDISAYPHGSFPELLDYIRSL